MDIASMDTLDWIASEIGRGFLFMAFFFWRFQNISAEVEFSLVNRLIVGVVRLARSNKNDTSGSREFVTLPPVVEFDVTIMVFGINGSIPNNDVSQIINRDQQFVGVLESIEGFDDAEVFDVFDYNRRDALEVDDEEEDVSEEEIAEDTEEPIDTTDDFDKGKDKEIDRGNRQPGKVTTLSLITFHYKVAFFQAINSYMIAIRPLTMIPRCR